MVARNVLRVVNAAPPVAQIITPEGKWNSPGSFANIRLGPTAYLEGGPSALTCWYAACPARLRNSGERTAGARISQPAGELRIIQPGLCPSASPLCACLRGGRGSRKACQGTQSTQRGSRWSRTSASARSGPPPSHSCRPNPRGEPPPLRWLLYGSSLTSNASGSYEHHVNTMDSQM